MANGWGGRREGSGRKPLPITLAKTALIANKIATAEAAFAFQEAILHDDTQPLINRQAAAIWIYEQIMGKAPQHMTLDSATLADWRAGKSEREVAVLDAYAAKAAAELESGAG